jgi:hypothetical protein
VGDCKLFGTCPPVPKTLKPKPKGPAMGRGTGERFRVWVAIPFVQTMDLLVNGTNIVLICFLEPESDVLHKRKEPPKLIITMFRHQQSKILMKKYFCCTNQLTSHTTCDLGKCLVTQVSMGEN